MIKTFKRFTRGLLFALILILLLVLRGCVLRPASTAALSTFNRGTNAAWLGIEWVNEPHTDAEIAALGAALEQQEINTIFVYVSYMRADGTFKNTYAEAPHFLSILKTAQPKIRVLAWIGIPLKSFAGGHADLSDANTRASIVKLCEELTKQGGFVGVHLDPEIIGNENPDLLRLLAEVRSGLDSKSILSLATQSIYPVFSDAAWLRLDGLPYWNEAYYRKVAALDQIAVMSYDSGLSADWLYQHWLRFQVINLTRALRDWNGELYIGIPNSEERTNSHDPNTENITAALNGLQAGLNDNDSIPIKVYGLSIYPYWEMDSAEFATYQKRWLGK